MNNEAGKRIMANKEQFIEMWNADVSSSEMGYTFGCNSSTINIYAKNLGLHRRYLIANTQNTFEEITQEELERRCEEVQRTWDDKTEWSRRVQKPVGALFANIAFRKGDCYELPPPPLNPSFDARKMNLLMSEQGNSREPCSPFMAGLEKRVDHE